MATTSLPRCAPSFSANTQSPAFSQDQPIITEIKDSWKAGNGTGAFWRPDQGRPVWMGRTCAAHIKETAVHIMNMLDILDLYVYCTHFQTIKGLEEGMPLAISCRVMALGLR